jgi:hypothetical protein
MEIPYSSYKVVVDPLCLYCMYAIPLFFFSSSLIRRRKNSTLDGSASVVDLSIVVVEQKKFTRHIPVRSQFAL